MVKDPTLGMRKEAARLASVDEGKACNQASFRVGNKAFLFVGPGAKGVGYKAMFKLHASMTQARTLAESEPTRFDVGKTGWVTARFTDARPLSAKIWKKWIRESYGLSAGETPKKATKKKATKKKATKKKARTKKKATKKKATKKKATKKKATKKKATKKKATKKKATEKKATKK